MSSDPDVRAISEGELGAWAYVLDASFLLPVPAGAVAYRQELYVPGRSLGAFDSGRCVGTLRSLDEVREYGPELHERFRRTQVGAIPRGPAAWRMRTGALRNPYQEWEEPSAVLYRDAAGTPAGMAQYRSDDNWRGGDGYQRP